MKAEMYQMLWALWLQISPPATYVTAFRLLTVENTPNYTELAICFYLGAFEEISVFRKRAYFARREVF
jgi:hypothetical protein